MGKIPVPNDTQEKRANKTKEKMYRQPIPVKAKETQDKKQINIP